VERLAKAKALRDTRVGQLSKVCELLLIIEVGESEDGKYREQQMVGLLVS
jgi:hypothetical protein